MLKSPVTPIHVNNALNETVKVLRELFDAIAAVSSAGHAGKPRLEAAMKRAETMLAAFVPAEMEEIARVMKDYHTVAGPTLDVNHKPVPDAAQPVAPAIPTAQPVQAPSPKVSTRPEILSIDIWRASWFRNDRTYGIIAHARDSQGKPVQMNFLREKADALAETIRRDANESVGDHRKVAMLSGSGVNVQVECFRRENAGGKTDYVVNRIHAEEPSNRPRR